MAEPPSDQQQLQLARSALERGDYGRTQALLTPLLEQHGVASRFGAELRLLLATAQMGQGDTIAAAATCRSLRACRDASLRSQARDLQEVLEAPALQRPREWSMTLPNFGDLQPLEGEFKAMARQRRRRDRPPPPPPPPTGATRAPLGFALLVIVLLALTALLGGCVDLETRVHVPAPGRLQLSQLSRSRTAEPLPWQRQLAAALQGTAFRVHQDHGTLRLQAPSLPAGQAIALLNSSVSEAARLAGIPLPPPQLQLLERNWLVGVRQRLSLEVDLKDLPPLPGLTLSVDLDPFTSRSVRRAEPLPAQPLSPRRGRPGALRWRLQPGAINQLELHCWRWSRLGLGAVAIGLLLALVTLLQRLRLAAGFGFPQLPA